MTGAAMIDAVLTQGGFDTSQAPRSMALGWIQEIISDAVARAKWRLRLVSLGPTVAGQSQYEVSATYSEVDEIKVGGARVNRVSTEQMWSIQNGDVLLYPGRLVFAPYHDAGAMTEGIELYPTPTEDGLEIKALARVDAVSVVDDSADVLAIPVDMHGRVVDEAIRLGRRRLFGVEYDESSREGLVTVLRERRNSRLGGGVQQLPVLRRRRG